ncbi:MAG TPA: MFS transporter [Terriglobales bacterium]|nr:MFS transporter [Terriglobales bacterium]
MAQSTESSHHLPRPSKTYRWIALVFVSLAQFGNYYIYDSINPLENIFRNQLGYSSEMFGWLNASYSVAAVLTLLIGGIIIDKLGIRKALLLFSALCFLGALLTALKGNFWVMVAGRTLLGLGAESQIVAVTTALAKWFKGKELSFAFGINLTIARLASVSADNSPNWAAWAFYPNGAGSEPSWQRPLIIAVAAGVICLVAALVYWVLEAAAERRFSLGSAGSIDKLETRDIFRFNQSYWYVVALCFTFYSAIFPFRTFAIEFFTSKLLVGTAMTDAAQVLAHGRAGFYNSLLPFSAMIATPLFGLLADRIGKRATLMMIGSVLLMPVYLMLAYSPLPLWIPVSMMGIAFSLIPAVMWPSVAYIVDEKKLGTAYALMSLIQQIGFFVLNLAIGRANDFGHASLTNVSGYALGMWIFSTLGFVGLFFSILLRIRERGPQAHGLETITAASSAK